MPREVPAREDDDQPGSGKGVMPAEFQLFFKHYLPVAKDVVTDTERFFEDMPEEFTLKDAAIFASVGLVIHGILSKLLQFNIVAIPFNVVMTFVMAGFFSLIFFGLAKAQGGKGTLEDTAKIVCYSTLVGFASWIPLVGIVPFLYGGYLISVGLKVVHELDMKRALVTTYLPMCMVGGLIFLLEWLTMLAKQHPPGT